jgi:hypothetical protein
VCGGTARRQKDAAENDCTEIVLINGTDHNLLE